MTLPFDIDTLVNSLRPQLVRYVGRLVGDADAEDVVQIALAKAAAALEDFRADSSPRSWLFRIATNAAYDWNRARRGLVREPIDTDGDDSGSPPASDAEQERQLLREEMSQCVGDVLRQLPESYQVVLALSDCDELSDREVAAVLGATVGSIKIRLHRARARLRQELERTCSFYRDPENVLCCDRRQKSPDGDCACRGPTTSGAPSPGNAS